MAKSPAPAFPAAGTLRQGSPPPPPTPRPTLPPAQLPPPRLGSRSGPRTTEQGPGTAKARAPSHGRLPLSDPKGPGARRGEAPESQRDRVSPRALPGAAVWGFACQPGMEASAPVPQGWEGGVPARVRRGAGTPGLAWWDTRPQASPCKVLGASARPRSHHDRIPPKRGCCPVHARGWQKGPRVFPDLSKQENTRVLKGSETFTSQSYLRGGGESSKELKSQRQLNSCWPSGSRDFDAALATHRNSLSCLFLGLLDGLRERAVLYQQQLGFCSGTATIRDAKY